VIIIDSREPLRIGEKLGELMVETRSETLEFGDYLVHDTLIERKEVRDFVSSLRDGRLERQVYHLSQFPHFILLIEGDINKLFLSSKIKNFTVSHFYGELASLYARHRLSFIFTKNIGQTCIFLKKLDDKLEKYGSGVIEKKGFSNINRVSNHLDKRVTVLTAIDGIGEKNAVSILDTYSLKELFSISVRELERVNGIGVVKAKSIKEVFV